MNRYQPIGLCLLPLFAAISAHSAEPNLRDPADARAAVPAVIYVSPFQNYKALGETKISPWKPANDLTEKIGGWRAYLKEAAQPDVVEPPAGVDKPAAPTPKPQQPDPHSGHKH